jgi:hypothetical protein
MFAASPAAIGSSGVVVQPGRLLRHQAGELELDLGDRERVRLRSWCVPIGTPHPPFAVLRLPGRARTRPMPTHSVA